MSAASSAYAAAAARAPERSAAFSPALEVDDAGFPVAFGGIALSQPGHPCPVFFCAPDESASFAGADWEALAALVSAGASVRLRFSVRALPLALAHLEQAGAGPGMPAALVYRLKSPFFQTAQTTLHEAAQLVRRLHPASPVDVLVGRFVAPVKPGAGRELAGRAIAVACEAGAPCKLAALLREAGARVFEQPVVQVPKETGAGSAANAGAGAEGVGAGAAADAAAFGAATLAAPAASSATAPAPAASSAASSTTAAALSCDVLAAGLADGAIDAVVLSDAQLAGAFFRMLGAQARTLLASTKLVACGPIAGSVVEQHGLVPALQTDSYVPSRVAEAVRALDFTLSAG